MALFDKRAFLTALLLQIARDLRFNISVDRPVECANPLAANGTSFYPTFTPSISGTRRPGSGNLLRSHGDNEKPDGHDARGSRQAKIIYISKVNSSSFLPSERLSSFDHLLAAIDIVSSSGDGRVRHEVYGERCDIGRANHAPDRERLAELVATRFQPVSEQRRR